MRHGSLPAALAVLVVYAFIAPVVAQAPASKALINQAATRIRELQSEADQLAKQSGSLLAELRRLEIQREIKRQALRQAEAELKDVTAAHTAAAGRLQSLSDARVASTPLVAERLVAIAKRGRGGYLRLLLEADNLRDLGRLTRGVAAVVELDRVRLDAHRRTVRAEAQASAELGTRRAAAASARDEAGRARMALDAAVAAHLRRLEEIDRQRDLTARYMGELQDAQAALLRQAPSAAPGAAATLPIQPFRGALDWPAPGRVLSRAGRSASGRLGVSVMRNGIEIAASEDEPVRAVHGGAVSYAAPFTGFGTLVILDHGGNAFTLYGYLSAADVAEGTRVERGAAVGRAGRSPSGVPSLYFELRIDGRPVDPVQWFRSPR
jgi:septal ring factor EnvC (AmiA/AmiB activator)